MSKTKFMSEKWPISKNILLAEGIENEKESLEKEQLQLIDDIFNKAQEKGVEVFLFAGFADEFVLNEGEIKRDHSDVDFVCMRKDAQAMMKVLADIGCENIKEMFDSENYYSDELSLKIIARRGDVSMDVPLLDFDEDRQRAYYAMINDDGKKFKIYFEKNMLMASEFSSDGSVVKVVSPLALIQTRVFYSSIENIEIRDKDRLASEMLRDKFFPGEDLSDPKFMPEIIEV